VDFVNGRGGVRKSLKVLQVEGKVILACFIHISFKIMLKINRERSERRKKLRNITVLGIQKSEVRGR